MAREELWPFKLKFRFSRLLGGLKLMDPFKVFAYNIRGHDERQSVEDSYV